MAYCKVHPHQLMLEGLAQLKVINMPLRSSTTRAPLLMQQAVAPFQTALPALEQSRSCISYGFVHSRLFSKATFLSKHDCMTLLSVVARFVCAASACLLMCKHVHIKTQLVVFAKFQLSAYCIACARAHIKLGKMQDTFLAQVSWPRPRSCDCDAACIGGGGQVGKGGGNPARSLARHLWLRVQESKHNLSSHCHSTSGCPSRQPHSCRGIILLRCSLHLKAHFCLI